MKLALVPTVENEDRRLAALDRYAILDTAPEQAFDDIAWLAGAICNTPIALVSLLDRDRQWFKARIGLNMTETPRALAFCNQAIEMPGAVMVVGDAGADPRFIDNPLVRDEGVRAYAGMALLSAEGAALGTVCVMDRTPRGFSDDQQQGLHALARQTQSLLELRRHILHQRQLLKKREASTLQLQREQEDLQRRHDDLKHVARHDPLTGLLNRAGMKQLLVDPEAMAKLERAPYALVVLDIDHFKRVNDQHGHLLGDRALRAVGEAIAGALRPDDLAIRYGGEEFVVVLPDSTLPTAFEVAERIRGQVAAADLPFAVSVSAGLAAGDPQHDRLREVFDRADQALYRAKASGRDRVVVDDSWRH